MKILHLKLKKEILIVGEADHLNSSTEGNELYLYDSKENKDYTFEGKWKFIGTALKLTEDVAEQFVKIGQEGFECWNYEQNKWGVFGFSPYDSFLSAVSAENWYWIVNPMGDEPKITENRYTEEYKYVQENPDELVFGDHYADWSMWQEAESHTFKNPLIFVKL